MITCKRNSTEDPKRCSQLFLIPHGCQEAITHNIRRFAPLTSEDERITVIASNKEAMEFDPFERKRVPFDNEGDLDRLNILIHNITLVRTCDHRIEELIYNRHCKKTNGKRILKAIHER